MTNAKKSKIAIIITISVLSLIVLLLVGLLIAAVRVVNHPGRSLFGYRLFLADHDTRNCNTGDLLLVRPVAPDALEPDDCIVCRTADDALLIYTFIDHTDGGKGLLAFDPNTTDYKEIAVSADDILGKLEKTLPVAGDILDIFVVNGTRSDERADGAQKTLATQAETEQTTPSTTSDSSEPESTEPATEEPTEATQVQSNDTSIDWLIGRSWFTAAVAPDTAWPEYGVVGETLTIEIFTFYEDDTFVRSGMEYNRLDLNAVPENSPYMIQEGTCWGIPAMGFPESYGTYFFDGQTLTLTYNEDYNTQGRTEQITSVQHDGDWLSLDGTSYYAFTYNYSFIALCEAFGIAYQ